MPRDNSTYPDDWRQIAEKDLARVEKLLSIGDAGLAGFCLQQAVEKFLKAFLLANGWRLKRIHDLESLLEDALAYDPSLEPFREICAAVSGFYVAERYPLSAVSGFTEEDVRLALEEVLLLVQRLRRART